MNTIKKLIAAGLIGSIAFSLSAQTTPPDAFVNEQGQLVIGDLPPIDPPAGEVVDGNLVIDGNTIVAPDATVDPVTGAITVDGTTLEVPELPKGGDFLVSWFGDDLYDYDGSLAPTQDQWYFSYRFKNLLHFASDNWVYSEELNCFMYLIPDGSSVDSGFWAFAQWEAGATQLFTGAWIYFITGDSLANFNDLRDNNGDGVNELADGDAGAQTLDGIFWATDAPGYDDQGSGFFFFSEYDDGNFVQRITIGADTIDPDGDDWVQVQSVVPAP